MLSTPLERLDDAVRRASEYVRQRPRRGVAHDDADDTLGTIECDDAVGFNPLALLKALDRRGARAVVIGQVAGIMHGSQELTGDLDLLWNGSLRSAPSIVAAFTDVAASIYDDEGRPLPLDVHAFALPKILFHSAGASGDCCTPTLPWGDLDIRGVIDRANLTTEHGTSIHYASLDDLITMRRASGRPKDLRRAAELQRLRPTD